ncbi:MAG: VWA domain-containing protein [Pyrinomonadaceae bacterium]
MSERGSRSKLLKSALCLLLLAPGAARAQTQGQPAEAPPRLKRDFGSSLKRLKWDAEEKKAVEVAPKGARRGEEGDEEEEVVRVETSLVVCDVLVLDPKGHVIRGLAREDFLITEDNQPQEVGMFSLGDSANVPRSIALIIDYSGSMRPFIENSVAAAKTLVDQLNPRDRMAIVTDDVELLVNFTRDKALLKKKLDGLERKALDGKLGRSLQYSALMATLREMFDEEDTRPIIIFQTDGDELLSLRDAPVPPRVRRAFPPPPPPDLMKQRPLPRPGPRAQFSIADVFKEAERSRATVYTVVPGIQLIGLKPGEDAVKRQLLSDSLDEFYGRRTFSPEGREATLSFVFKEVPPQQTALYELSKLSGGWTSFLEEPSQAAGIYANIFSDIGSRYVVGFYPTNKERDGKRRRVQVEVRGHPEYTVIGRKSYYAPGP